MMKTMKAAAVICAMSSPALGLDLRDDSYLDHAAGMLATNEVCGPVFHDDMLRLAVTNAAGQLGLTIDEAIPRISARAVWVETSLRTEMPTHAARDRWCREMRDIVYGRAW